MPHQALDYLTRTGQLKAERPSASEIAGLIRSGRARLKDAGNESLSQESRFDLAYNAAHALALAALRWHGFRSANRFLVFQCLTHTINMSPEQWRVLDQAHRKRNLAEYEGQVDIEDQLITAIIRVAGEVEQRVVDLGPAE